MSVCRISLCWMSMCKMAVCPMSGAGCPSLLCLLAKNVQCAGAKYLFLEFICV